MCSLVLESVNLHKDSFQEVLVRYFLFDLFNFPEKFHVILL